ncbi:hypothetical protein JM946_15305 [Steroidobacter sp. S1-65]|uniref:Uncharacterized protein n=1 Tax=Steroidobacter gossypii TaxID=2805490 RepID=A0ABS1WYP6_9GAMM|nr:hypothetical protein [Steroidobacter gossypii]MBM0106100.1 hypothetical protein [Steroidobacter gossypii]
MRLSLTALCLTSMAAAIPATAAEIDARPPDKLSVSGNVSNFRNSDADGGGGALSYLHYLTPNALVGGGVDHTFVEDTELTYGSLRGAWGRGEPSSRFTFLAEAYYGEGDDVGRKFDYRVGVLGISQALTSKFSVQLETRQFEIDTTDGNLPELGLTYVWTPRFVTNVSYAKSVSGNLGTELTSARADYYGKRVNLLLGGSTGTANPAVLVPLPGVVLPPTHSTQGFVGIGRTFKRGEFQLLGDYLKVSDSEKITVTLTFTAFLGSRGR